MSPALTSRAYFVEGCTRTGKHESDMGQLSRVDAGLVDGLIICEPAKRRISRSRHGWYLLWWLAYSFFVFFVWEARVLCRHCPYWAGAERMLRCHANYGVMKIWKYGPGPMSGLEKVQFVAGVLIWVAFPFPFVLLGRQYLLALIGATTAASGAYLLGRNVCSRCINFSCPVNSVPKQLADAYIRRNPEIQAAWEARGYRRDRS